MSVTAVQVRRRGTGQTAGAPASLKSGEIAYNMTDGYFYVGYGDSGGGVATSIKAFAKDDFNISKLLPAGGTTGQALTKSNGTDYNVAWATITSGGTYTAGSGLTLTGSDFAVDFAVVAAKASPTFTGVPAAPTAAVDTNTTQLATTAYVIAQSYLKSATAASTYAPLASPALTGVPAAPTAAADTNTTQLATTAYVVGQGYLKSSVAASTYAPLASPNLTGTPAAPTASQGTNTTQLATTAFVNAAVAASSEGLNPKQSVKAATTANITLSGAQTIDGIALVATDRCLVKDQSTPANNGVYVVSAGAWTRATDLDAWAEFPGAHCWVQQGTVNADQAFVCTSDAGGTLNTTAVTFVQFSGLGQIVAGNGIAKTGNTLSVNYAGAGLTINGSALELTSMMKSFAGLTIAADTLAYGNGSGTFSTTALTAYGRSLIDDVDATAARATLGLGSMATQAASAVAITGGTIDGVTIDGGTF